MKFYKRDIKKAIINETKKKLEGCKSTRNDSVKSSSVKQYMSPIWSDDKDISNSGKYV